MMPAVKTGLQILLTQRRRLIVGRRLGLVTHPPAVLPDLTHIAVALQRAGAELAAFFGPEHGYSAAAADGAAVDDSHDPATGLPVYSLYGPTKEPAPAMLAGLDVLVVDLQDVGARFYTFISTLYYVLRGAARADKPVIVLDRPNPINGLAVEGPGIQPGFESFVGIQDMPVRHGLTTGELARHFNRHYALGAELTVVPMQGWRRALWFDQTRLPWTPLSPGMPQLSTAVVYPGMCFVEGTNLSEGRGTSLPFEVVGAPWLHGERLAAALNALDLPGVRFRPHSFEPSASKHAGQLCQGVQVHVLDRQRFRPVETGVHVVAACRAQAPQHFEFLPSSWEGGRPHFDLLLGSAHVRQGLQAGEPAAALLSDWPQAVQAFESLRQQVLLY